MGNSHQKTFKKAHDRAEKLQLEDCNTSDILTHKDYDQYFRQVLQWMKVNYQLTFSFLTLIKVNLFYVYWICNILLSHRVEVDQYF